MFKGFWEAHDYALLCPACQPLPLLRRAKLIRYFFNEVMLFCLSRLR
ncbi:hypothetical protein D8I24_4747 [Cupriavidus necator H850]|nr:hypothetical protein D8I24_4747 [Cupriavidus necator H850]